MYILQYKHGILVGEFYDSVSGDLERHAIS